MIQADIQNKLDIASLRAREWIDGDVSLLVGGGARSSGLAVQEIAARRRPAEFAR